MKRRNRWFLIVGAVLVACQPTSGPVGGGQGSDQAEQVTATDTVGASDSDLATRRVEYILTQTTENFATAIPPSATATVEDPNRTSRNNPPILPTFDPDWAGLTLVIDYAPTDFELVDLWQVMPDGSVEIIGEWFRDGALSPDGSMYIYDQDGDIFMRNMVTGEIQQLTFTEDLYETGPWWLPDSSTRFFYLESKYEFGGGWLTLAALDGPSTKLEDFGWPVEWPTFASDGSKVAYTYVEEGSTIVGVIYEDEFGERQLDLPGFGRDDVTKLWELTFSPDGTKLVASANIRSGEQNPELRSVFFLLDLTTTTQIEIIRYSTIPTERGRTEKAPRWAPSGEWFVFSIDSYEEETAGVWRYELATSRLTRIGEPTPGYFAVSNMRISPDGDWLAVSFWNERVWLVDTESWEIIEWAGLDGIYSVQWIASP